jgi:hypothetical protein
MTPMAMPAMAPEERDVEDDGEGVMGRAVGVPVGLELEGDGVAVDVLCEVEEVVVAVMVAAKPSIT